MISFTMKVNDEEIAMVNKSSEGVVLHLHETVLEAPEAVELITLLQNIDWNVEGDDEE